MAQLNDAGATQLRADWLRLLDAIPDSLPCSRHPLGFLHIELTPLTSLAAGERLRLHYWPETGSNPDELGTLHDHIWTLTSVVAAGVLRDRTYRPTPNPLGGFAGTRVTYGRDRSEFVGEGAFDLKFERELVVGQDEIYRIESRVVHNTAVLEAPAVTFVLAHDDQDASTLGPLLLHPRDLAGSGTAVRDPYDCSVALSLIRERIATR